ncbi:unnamed protein product [Cyprideis torosa]|uniref:Uncharacterized protein n=1 Tax=Cyprideis torosa TaxID=163714 RepID=A0A7R8WPM7_9CRUS|nr:unnamed protein product [Cyprideis torosa]CAG0901713.1 unnamed protein product [Cyprideis torosa]
MQSLFFESLLALALVGTIDGALDLSSSERPKTPVYNGQCNPPFTPVEGSHCYFLSYDEFETNWMRAQQFCSWLHPEGRLAEFETLEELVGATVFLTIDNQNGTYPWTAPGPWIGAIELGDSNEFVWASSNSSIEATNWSPSRPNSPTVGDGVALDASNNFEWIDLSNGTEVPILCEMPWNPPVELICPDGFSSLGNTGNSCYRVYDDRTSNWTISQTFYYWIGGEEREDTGIFEWASTDQWIDNPDWYPGQPDYSGSEAAIFLWCYGNWQWLDENKGHYCLFICEAPPIEG